MPAHITDCAADSGGFVASRIWGEYRYSPAEYVQWLASWRPRWAATMDYCCERELAVVTRERQVKTTINAWHAWNEYRHVPWAWVPTVQGFDPDDYRRHAWDLRPLIEEMHTFYAKNPAWRVGIGTLCHRDDVVMVQAILHAVREVLPDVPLHLWGIKLDALRSIDLTNVVSTDSAVWHGAMYAKEQLTLAAHERGMSKRAYMVTVNLPAYVAKVEAAVAESRHVSQSQHDTALLGQVRTLLQHQGWTLQLRTRRNRTYVYAARRQGQRVEQRYLCAVSQIATWLERSSSVRPLA